MTRKNNWPARGALRKAIRREVVAVVGTALTLTHGRASTHARQWERLHRIEQRLAALERRLGRER